MKPHWIEQSTCVGRSAIIASGIDEFCQFVSRHGASPASGLVTFTVAPGPATTWQSAAKSASPQRCPNWFKVHADNFDHGRSASSPGVRDGSALPTQLPLAVMHDTLRIGANAKVVSERQICRLQFWACASAVASRLVLDHNNERSLAAMRIVTRHIAIAGAKLDLITTRVRIIEYCDCYVSASRRIRLVAAHATTSSQAEPCHIVDATGPSG